MSRAFGLKGRCGCLCAASKLPCLLAQPAQGGGVEETTMTAMKTIPLFAPVVLFIAAATAFLTSPNAAAAATQTGPMEASDAPIRPMNYRSGSKVIAEKGAMVYSSANADTDFLFSELRKAVEEKDEAKKLTLLTKLSGKAGNLTANVLLVVVDNISNFGDFYLLETTNKEKRERWCAFGKSLHPYEDSEDRLKINKSLQSAKKSSITSYEVLQEEHDPSGVASYDVSLVPEGNILPEKSEMGKLAQKIVEAGTKGEPIKQTVVRFYLPGQILGRGAYAVVSFDPAPSVEIHTIEPIAQADSADGEAKNRITTAVNKSLGNAVKEMKMGGSADDGFVVNVSYNFRTTGRRFSSTSEIRTAIENNMRCFYSEVFSTGVPVKNATIAATMFLPDKYGNQDDIVVYQTALDSETASKINWGNSYMIDFTKLWKTQTLHSELQN